MNTTIRNLIAALPLAAAALTMAPGAAMADDGPIIVLPPPDGDPQGPVIANPTPDEDPVDPTGPDDLTAPPPCPTHGVDCDGGDDDETGDGDKGDQGGQGGQPEGTVESIALPTRIDAGLAPTQPDADHLELSWLLAGGALVTASGAAFAARRVRARA